MKDAKTRDRSHKKREEGSRKALIEFHTSHHFKNPSGMTMMQGFTGSCWCWALIALASFIHLPFAVEAIKTTKMQFSVSFAKLSLVCVA
mmetsp:Transcript_38235/g.79535  ORF Transcript_38235/g.79535 Transcript_38235/m.79535 type:complete len:89 (+) Transcript_38235:265-531(+)